MNFINYGYYIVEPVVKPEYVHLECKKILTVSTCICNQHPSLYGTFWDNHLDEQMEYQKLLKLSDKEFEDMKETVSYLFCEHKLDHDSRFAELLDALNFYHKYLHYVPLLQIVSITLEDAYRDRFLDEIKDSNNIPFPLKEKPAGGILLGYDILGWDYGSFHTYLCNSLEKDILEKYPLEVNELGFIQNPYMQVKKFAEYIAGKGEPVLWLPFAVNQHLTD